ncbi:protein of unknown function [Xenorhabdus doucetiae]|uniref:Uncharacterized protein n=1 Tax=Xenorhabdus doucetiae TaxID=351671 RepID=A0A068QP74_9GAMM|nr:hypothetical protein LY16_01530 [Xenorhabdus doucetiae]CDG16599.1 protein of unknown function [Xenorhabdus doucetiae]
MWPFKMGKNTSNSKLQVTMPALKFEHSLIKINTYERQVKFKR